MEANVKLDKALFEKRVEEESKKIKIECSKKAFETVKNLEDNLTKDYAEKFEKVTEEYEKQYIKLEEEYKKYIDEVEEKSKLQIKQIISDIKSQKLIISPSSTDNICLGFSSDNYCNQSIGRIFI